MSGAGHVMRGAVALSRQVHAQGFKAVVTGEGADEAFAGYVWFKIREAARSLDIGDAFRPSTAIGRVARKWAAPNLSFGEFARIDGLIGGPHAQSILYNLVARSRDRYYSQGLKERLGSFVAYEDLALDLERMRRWHPLNRSLYLGYKTLLAGLLMTQKGDRVAMANSVEARYPFLDEDVIAFASRLHPRWKLHGLMGDKYLLRRAARSARCPPKSPGVPRACSGRPSPSHSLPILRPSCATWSVPNRSRALAISMRRRCSATARCWRRAKRPSSAILRALASAGWWPPSSGITSISAAACASCRR